jgi:TatA/E family protein of Tat protein translocase
MFGIGMPELIVILVVALIVFGPKQLPDLAKTMGQAMREFKKATSDFRRTIEVESDMGDVRKEFDKINLNVKETIEIKPKSEPEKTSDMPSASETPQPVEKGNLA